MSNIFPSWRYRRCPHTHAIESKIFNNVSELMNAGEGWKESPAHVYAERLLAASEALKAAEAHSEGEAGSPIDDPALPEPQNEDSALDFTGIDDDALREIACKAGIKIDGRWGRARLEEELRGASNGGNA